MLPGLLLLLQDLLLDMELEWELLTLERKELELDDWDWIFYSLRVC